MSKIKIFAIAVSLLLSVAAIAQDQRRVAIFDPVGDATNHVKGIVREEISASIMRLGEFIVLERSLIDRVLEESRFQASGLVDDAQISEMGRMMGANYVFVTSISPVGRNFHISYRLVNVSTARVEKQATATTAGRGRMEDVMISVRYEINRMFLGVTDLRLEGRAVFANDIRLDNREVQNLMANTEALRLFDRGLSQRRGGTWLVWGGILAFVAGAGTDLVNFGTSYPRPGGYVQEGNIIYRREVYNLQGTVIGGIIGCALIGGGIVLRSSGRRSLQRSVDMYNSERRATQAEVRLGTTGNGVGLAINF